MKTLFSVGFQSNNPFTVRHPSLAQAPSLGFPRQMGQETSEFEHIADAEAQANAELRAKLNTMIAAGNKKLAAIKSWIAARIDQDPTLEKSFGGDKVVSYNILDWMDNLVAKDQYYADLAAKKAASPDPQNWDFSESLLGYVNEWANVIDQIYDAIQQRGNALPNKPGIQKMGPVTQTIINPKTGAPVTTNIAPGAVISSPAPTSGISTNTLLIGGGVAAALIGLVLALKA